MAIKIDVQYPNATPADADYPFGSIKNASTPGGLDGTPLDKVWKNDDLGFKQRLLIEAGITPSGVADTVLASDYFDALKAIIIKSIGLNSTSGFVPSNNGGNPNTHIDFSIGSGSDSTNLKLLSLNTATTKDFSNIFAAGSGNGGLYTAGGLIASTTYHFFTIEKDSDSSIDIYGDISPIAANIPAGYTAYRRIHSTETDSSGFLKLFSALEKSGGSLKVTWKDTQLDRPLANLGVSTRFALTLSIPADIVMIAQIHASFQHNNTTHVLIRPTNSTDIVPSATDFTMGVVSAGPIVSEGSIFNLETDILSQIAIRGVNTGSQLLLDTIGYLDRRID